MSKAEAHSWPPLLFRSKSLLLNSLMPWAAAAGEMPEEKMGRRGERAGIGGGGVEVCFLPAKQGDEVVEWEGIACDCELSGRWREGSSFISWVFMVMEGDICDCFLDSIRVLRLRRRVG